VSDDRDGPGASFERLVELIARLRGPGGCPWDREQTHQTLKPMTLEEAYEVVEAIDGSDDQLAGELGDLLLQVVFHSQIAREGSRFDVGDVIEHVNRKMIRRHPHVFGDESASSSEEVLRSWEQIKRDERNGSADESMLESVSRGHPAVMEAFQMSTKVSRVGFDWPGVEGALGKLGEELGELRAALSEAEPDGASVEEEIGDLLFAAVNVARLAGVDPESALKAANRKFRRRFAHVEARLRDRDSSPGDSSLDEMEELWADAKARGL
jgi:MazG family protein